MPINPSPDARIVVTGATGFLGQQVVKALLHAGYGVTALVRNPLKASAALPPPTQCVAWNGLSGTSVSQALEGAYGIVHLAGESLAQWPWSRKRKQALRKSRIELTRNLVEGITACRVRPTVLVMASGAGFYGSGAAQPMLEADPPGHDFLGQLAKAWEEEGFKAESLGLRVIPLRMGMILGKSGGALPRLALPFRYGLGAILGNGKQGQAWIHSIDAVALILFALGNVQVTGPLNACAPELVSQAEFSRSLSLILHRPLFFKVPAFALRLFLGEMADILLHGQFAPPHKAVAAGFQFQFPALTPALKDILES